MKTIFNHSLICQFLKNHFNNSSINPHSISLSLSLWMKTQTHTQLINIYHTNHHQSISSTTTIHVHSFSFHKQHTQSLSQNNHFSSQSSKSISSSFIRLIRFNNTFCPNHVENNKHHLYAYQMKKKKRAL